MRQAIVLLAAAVVCSCGGGGSSARSAAVGGNASPSPSPTRAAGGLVGAIDRARLLSVCENARQADTVLQTGMGTSQVDDFLTGAAKLLERPPVDAEAQALGQRVDRDVTAGRREQAVTALTTFCHARGA